MAEADTRRMSTERQQHEAHPRRPRSASKPGTSDSAKPSRRGGNGSNRGGGSRSASGGGGGGRGASGEHDSKHSLPGSKTLQRLGELSLPRPHLSIWTRLAGKLLKRLAKHELKKLMKVGGGSLAQAVPSALAHAAPESLDKPREALETSRDAFDFSALRPALPIQEAVDVAVPLDFIWQKWMELGLLPEGVDSAVDIDRDGNELTGRLAADPGRSWRAEILDERDCESFAWKSSDGSDCAGLVTFHSLSDRLTRIELTLDVVPRDASDSAVLLTHLAHWRARRELRRFKAELELVSPDVYARDESSSSR